ncbi:MAG TPA: hypothetical protein PLW65_21950, partial [Pseudomonadota bacterium]|nr:hypothetical protein [Pseudomonadota bacterium]
MPHELLAPTLLHLSWVRIRVSPENRAEPAPCRAPTVKQQPFGGLQMSTQVVKKIVTSKAGQVVLGGIAAGAVGTVGVVVANKWVRTKLADRERRKIEAAAEKERQRLAALAEKERQRLAALAEKERQRLAALAEKERLRAAAQAEKERLQAIAQAAEAARKAERRTAMESRV